MWASRGAAAGWGAAAPRLARPAHNAATQHVCTHCAEAARHGASQLRVTGVLAFYALPTVPCAWGRPWFSGGCPGDTLLRAHTRARAHTRGTVLILASLFPLYHCSSLQVFASGFGSLSKSSFRTRLQHGATTWQYWQHHQSAPPNVSSIAFVMSSSIEQGRASAYACPPTGSWGRPVQLAG